MKKNIVIVVLALVMTLSFTACGTKTVETPPTDTVTVTETNEVMTTEVTDKTTPQPASDEVVTDKVLTGTFVEVARANEDADEKLQELIETTLKEHPSLYVFKDDGTVEDHHWDLDLSKPETSYYERVDTDTYYVKGNTLYITKDRNGTWTQKYILNEDGTSFTGTYAGYTTTFEMQ